MNLELILVILLAMFAIATALDLRSVLFRRHGKRVNKLPALRRGKFQRIYLMENAETLDELLRSISAENSSSGGVSDNEIEGSGGDETKLNVVRSRRRRKNKKNKNKKRRFRGRKG